MAFEFITKRLRKQPRPSNIPPAVTSAPAKSFQAVIAAAFGGGLPGNWQSDHREEMNQFTDWNYVACRAIALQASQCDVSISRQSDTPRTIRKGYSSDETKTPVEDSHPLYKLLQHPNEDQSGADQRYLIALHLCLAGSAFILKIPNRLGRTVQRFVIPQPWLSPLPPSDEYPRGAYQIQPYQTVASYFNGDSFADLGTYMPVLGATVPAENFIVIKWPHPMYLFDGRSATAAGASWIDSSRQIDLSRWYQMRNGVDPSIVISPNDPNISLSEDELAAASAKFNEKYTRPENHGKAVFLSGKTEITKLSQSPSEMAYVEAFLQLRDSILALHGVPGVAAGITDGGSYAAFVASLKQFQSMTIQPMLNMVAEKETRKQAPEFGEGLTVEYLAKGIDDPAVTESQIRTDVSAGAITVNELRQLRGREPIPGGDVPCRQQTIGGNPTDRMPDERGAGEMAGADSTTSGMGGQGKPPAMGKRLGSFNKHLHHSNGHSDVAGMPYP